ncbi:MAG: cell division protein FtsZ [Spirochaetaceae bacterium]|nr:cell division protein FtsZ [Spirochaetaceae bacterium]|tara:strand:+ start:5609 stop:7048 length:1440 start_codon:yes stop_codon:yes gene_type:complete
MLQLEEEKTSPTLIKVVGVGGGGMNAVNRMIDANLKGVEFIVVNTDEQVIRLSAAEEKVVIGQKTTRGMGAGGDPEIGLRAAQEDRDRLAQTLKGADMVFITAGMGGGTGTGAAPIVAEVARDVGALTVGVITLPFQMEGARRMKHAVKGLEAMKEHVDTLITIKNDHIFKVVDRTTPVDVAFRMVDEILLGAVRGISDLINTAGLVNVDFADVRSIMAETGDAIMGSGEGIGENRVMDAVNLAINNALLEDMNIEGATGVLINVCGGEDLSMAEWKDVSELVTAHVDPQANIIIGLTIDEGLRDRIRVTVIATGFDKSQSRRKPGGWKGYQEDGRVRPYHPVQEAAEQELRGRSKRPTAESGNRSQSAGIRPSPPAEEEHPPVVSMRQFYKSDEEPAMPRMQEIYDDFDDSEEMEPEAPSQVMPARRVSGDDYGTNVATPMDAEEYYRTAGRNRMSAEKKRTITEDDLDIPAYLRRKG